MKNQRKAPEEYRNRDAGRGPDKGFPVGDSGKPDSEPGPDRILSLARGGDPEAQFKASEMYQSGDGRVPFDFAESTRWLIAAAEQGHTTAQEFLGECYYEGDGVEKDFEQAAKWFRVAAKAGNLDARFHLGRMYACGEADMEGDPDGERWLAVADSVFYDYNSLLWASLMGLYDDGTLPRPDEPESFHWLRRAAVAGQRAAQYVQGSAYLNGERVDLDKAEAAKWFRKAAIQGCKRSQAALGVMFLNGGGM